MSKSMTTPTIKPLLGWAYVKDGEIQLPLYRASATAVHYRLPGERVVQVEVRVVEKGAKR